MGKRKGGENGGKDKKRQRSYALIEPGVYGIYASCARFKEVAGAKEMRIMLQEAIEKYYPKEEGEEEGEEEEEEKKPTTIDIEDEIQKELMELKKNDDKARHNRHNKDLIMREIPIGVESLTFFKLKQPIKPSELLVNMCKDLYESGRKTGRFVQKLVAIDRSCNATKIEFEKMLENAINTYKEEMSDDGGNLFETYNVNLIKRNFDTISRDEFMEIFNDILIKNLGEGKSRLQYKGSKTLFNVYCFKNNIGISIVDNKQFENLCKFNVQQIFDKASGNPQEGKTVGDEKKL